MSEIEDFPTPPQTQVPSMDESGWTYPFAQDSAEAHGIAEDENGVEPQTLYQSDLDGLRKMKEEIANIPHSKKSCYVHVQRKKPELVDEKNMLMFLRAENDNPKLAAKRLTAYWETRHKIFGEDYCLPITLTGALRNNLQDFKNSFLSLLPITDNEGRAIIYSYTPSISVSKDFTGLGQLRVWWYLVHLAMKIPGVTEKGFIIVSNAKDSPLNNFDAQIVCGIVTTADRVFPIRQVAMHCCFANPVFPFVEPIVRSFLSPSQRQRFISHNGSTETVVASLAKFNIPREAIPFEGGTLNFSVEEFVRDRMAIENVKIEDAHGNAEHSNTLDGENGGKDCSSEEEFEEEEDSMDEQAEEEDEEEKKKDVENCDNGSDDGVHEEEGVVEEETRAELAERNHQDSDGFSFGMNSLQSHGDAEHDQDNIDQLLNPHFVSSAPIGNPRDEFQEVFQSAQGRHIENIAHRGNELANGSAHFPGRMQIETSAPSMPSMPSMPPLPSMPLQANSENMLRNHLGSLGVDPSGYLPAMQQHSYDIGNILSLIQNNQLENLLGTRAIPSNNFDLGNSSFNVQSPLNSHLGTSSAFPPNNFDTGAMMSASIQQAPAEEDADASNGIHNVNDQIATTSSASQPPQEQKPASSIQANHNISSRENETSVPCSTSKAKTKPKQASSDSGGKKSKSSKSKNASHWGRTGDPRMKLAVEGKLADPHMPLITALLRGGFVFPGIDEPGVKLSAVKDTDGVTVYQRRNQLLRRLRLEREKGNKKS